MPTPDDTLIGRCNINSITVSKRLLEQVAQVRASIPLSHLSLASTPLSHLSLAVVALHFARIFSLSVDSFWLLAAKATAIAVLGVNACLAA